MPQVIWNIYFIFGMFFCSYEQGTDKYPRRQGKRADRVPTLSINQGGMPPCLTESELASLKVVSVGAVFDDRNYSVTNAEP